MLKARTSITWGKRLNYPISGIRAQSNRGLFQPVPKMYVVRLFIFISMWHTDLPRHAPETCEIPDTLEHARCWGEAPTSTLELACLVSNS